MHKAHSVKSALQKNTGAAVFDATPFSLCTAVSLEQLSFSRDALKLALKLHLRLSKGCACAAAPHIARFLGAAAAAFAAFTGLKAVWAQRAQAAGVAFKNLLAARPDPSTLSRADLQNLGAQWGLDPSKALVDDLKQAYDTYIQWVMPPLDGDLK